MNEGQQIPGQRIYFKQIYWFIYVAEQPNSFAIFMVMVL